MNYLMWSDFEILFPYNNVHLTAKIYKLDSTPRRFIFFIFKILLNQKFTITFLFLLFKIKNLLIKIAVCIQIKNKFKEVSITCFEIQTLEIN